MRMRRLLIAIMSVVALVGCSVGLALMVSPGAYASNYCNTECYNTLAGEPDCRTTCY